MSEAGVSSVARVVVATAQGGPEVLAVIEAPLSAPGPGEVLVEVRAAGVNPIDAKSYGGFYGPPAELPLRLGSEAAGVVRAVGEGTRAADGPLAVGDEVIAYRISGAYADAVVVPGSSLVHKPAALGWAPAGGLMLTGVTAVHALTATEVSTGDTVLVHAAAGAVGLMAVQLARLRGARVIGTASPRHHELLRELGAEPVEYGEGLVQRVRALAPGGVDVAIDAVGTPEAVESSLALVADRQRIVSLVANPGVRASGLRILGGGPGADPGTEIRTAARLELVRLVTEGELRVVVAATYPLADVADAHRAIQASHPAGKIILIP